MRATIVPLALLLAFGCNPTDTTDHIATQIKEISPRFKEITVSQSAISDTIRIHEDSYIFDSVYNTHKANLVAYIYTQDAEDVKPVHIAFRKDTEWFYTRTMSAHEIEETRGLYSKNKKYLDAQKFIFGEYEAIEQWNILTALASLMNYYSAHFTHEDYLLYVQDATMSKEDACIKLRLLHIMLEDVQLEDFWNTGGPRKSAAELTDKFNRLCNIIGCTPIDTTDSFDQEFAKLQ